MSGTVSDNISQSSGSVTEPAGGVSILGSDPTLTEGLLWYNSSSNVLKVARLIGAWGSGGNLTESRLFITGAGTLTAGLAWGGTSGGGAGKVSTSEEYNGTAWTAGNSIGTAIYNHGGCGTQTAALSAGGTTLTNVAEEYDGTNWTTSGVGTLGAAMAGNRCGGTQSSAISTAGYASGSYTAVTEEYDGSTWGSGGALSDDRETTAVTGASVSACLCLGGEDGGGKKTITEEYNGTAWSTGGALAVATARIEASGTVDAALSFGGQSASDFLTTAQTYNGSAWSSGDTLTQKRGQHCGDGTSTATFCAGGGTSTSSDTPTDNTEEFAEAVTARTISNS